MNNQRVRGQVENQVRSHVWEQFGRQLASQASQPVTNRVGSQVRDQVWIRANSAVWYLILEQVDDRD